MVDNKERKRKIYKGQSRNITNNGYNYKQENVQSWQEVIIKERNFQEPK